MIRGSRSFILWLVWIVVWIAMARGVKSVAERAKGSRAHYLPMAVAVVLLAAPRLPLFPLDVRFVPAAPWPAELGLALTFAGLAFAVWARARLADNWSSSVTLKRDHELIDDGPYRWVRHPIYTGLLVALAGAALAVGEWRGVIAVALAAASAPHVIGCGGTAKPRAGEETVWNNDPGKSSGEGTGGGYSTLFSMPSWQAGAPNGPGRMVPDVAADADPDTGYEIVLYGEPTVVGGTSAVAPLYAGLFAAFGTKLGFVTPELYLNPTCFNDITKGGNGAYRARVGPDPCTGLGSPIGTSLANLLTHPAATPTRWLHAAKAENARLRGVIAGCERGRSPCRAREAVRNAPTRNSWPRGPRCRTPRMTPWVAVLSGPPEFPRETCPASLNPNAIIFKKSNPKCNSLDSGRLRVALPSASIGSLLLHVQLNLRSQHV